MARTEKIRAGFGHGLNKMEWNGAHMDTCTWTLTQDADIPYAPQASLCCLDRADNTCVFRIGNWGKETVMRAQMSLHGWVREAEQGNMNSWAKEIWEQSVHIHIKA